MDENLTTRHGKSRGKRKNLARCYGQDLMRGEHIMGRRANAAIPGGGTGKNSAYLFRTPDGYAAGEDAQAFGTGTSVFDPVLCEIVYSWFCPQGGAILDPFAGGSVRGIVAARMGYVYTGIDLSRRQIEANQQQAAEIVPQHCPNWIVGDSAYVRDLASGPFDLVFTCPPRAR